MPKAIVSVNFYGHQNPNISGLKYGTVPLTRAFFKAAGAYVFGSNFDRVQEDKVKDIKSSNGKLWVYDYNAALNETDNKSFTKRLVDDIMMEIAKGEPNGNTPEMAFLLTGFSSGGVTAMHMAQQLEQIYMNVYYVGLSMPLSNVMKVII